MVNDRGHQSAKLLKYLERRRNNSLVFRLYLCLCQMLADWFAERFHYFTVDFVNWSADFIVDLWLTILSH